MFVVHPFSLVPCLLAAARPAALFARRAWATVAVAAVLALAAGEALLLLDDQAAFNDYKAIYAPLHVPGQPHRGGDPLAARALPVARRFHRAGRYGRFQRCGPARRPGPPATLGLYRDGNRVAALPKAGGADVRYAPATLAALPYILRPRATGAGRRRFGRLPHRRGRWRSAPPRCDVVEPEPVLRTALRQGLGPSPASAATRRARAGRQPDRAAESGARYDVVDLSADFLDEAEANTERLRQRGDRCLPAALAPGGIVSIPVSIREFPAYAIRMLATARAGVAGGRGGGAGPARAGLSLRLERAHPALRHPVRRRPHRRRQAVL